MSQTKPQHSPMDQFPVANGELLIGGISLTQLASRVGQTPFYAYDRTILHRQVENLRRALPDAISLHYAIKANPMPAVVNFLAGLVDGMDVASLGELRTALDAGVNPNEISFAGPGKSNTELEGAIASGITLNLESEAEMLRAVHIGEALGIRPRTAIRINPDFELKTSGMKMSGGPKPFGVDAERVPDMLSDMRTLDLEFRGFHIFSGSQNLRPQAIIEAQNKTFELAFRLAEQAPSPITLLNIGGGFGIPYFPGDQRLDLSSIAENLDQRLPDIRSTLPEAEIVIELGRYLVGESGIYVCAVIDKKVSRGQTYLITNGGLHHHLAVSGNFGQVLRKNYPVAIGNRMDQPLEKTVNVVGPLCTPLDILADKVSLPEAEVGDLFVVFLSGAYGLTASPMGFLSHPPPGEILV